MTLGLDHVLWWADPFGHHLTNLSPYLLMSVAFIVLNIAALHRKFDS